MNVAQVNFLFFLFLIVQCNGAPRFANYIQNNMVLQQAPQRAVVWGYGNANTLTIIQMNDKIYRTLSSSEPANEVGDSIWSVSFDPTPAGGPFDLHVSQPLDNGTLVTITIYGVLFGDVWICSGESNMQMTVSLIFNASEEIANAANYPRIRLFTADLVPSDTPIEELAGIRLNWALPTPDNIGGPDWYYMSAVCWLYGRMLHEALGGRPIGLIATSWGGTAIELWMPPKALQDCGVSTNGGIALKPYGEPSPTVTLSNSNLYNAMIYPFTRIVIYGAIWYQGEANAGDNIDQYKCKFTKMIQYWRQIWNERTNGINDIQFPFGFVQLSTYTSDTSKIGFFPAMRWHQTFDLGYVPNSVISKVFMAVALDLRDDSYSMHPRYKHDVGYRLSRASLAVAYGQPVEFQGPIVRSVAYSTGGETLNITYISATSIDLRTSNGFDVCCKASDCLDDSAPAWVVANITSKNDLTITVTIPNSCVGQQLYGFRYLWRETPCPFKLAAIYSGTDSNLPSPPYFQRF